MSRGRFRLGVALPSLSDSESDDDDDSQLQEHELSPYVPRHSSPGHGDDAKPPASDSPLAFAPLSPGLAGVINTPRNPVETEQMREMFANAPPVTPLYLATNGRYRPSSLKSPFNPVTPEASQSEGSSSESGGSSSSVASPSTTSSTGSSFSVYLSEFPEDGSPQSIYKQRQQLPENIGMPYTLGYTYTDEEQRQGARRIRESKKPGLKRTHDWWNGRVDYDNTLWERERMLVQYEHRRLPFGDVSKTVCVPCFLPVDAHISEISSISTAVTNEVAMHYANKDLLRNIIDVIVFVNPPGGVPFVANFEMMIISRVAQHAILMKKEQYSIIIRDRIVDAIKRHLGYAVPTLNDYFQSAQVFCKDIELGRGTIVAIKTNFDTHMLVPITVWVGGDYSTPQTPGFFVVDPNIKSTPSTTTRAIDWFRHINRTNLGATDIQAPEVITFPPMCCRIVNSAGVARYDIDAISNTPDFSDPNHFSYQFAMIPHHRLLRSLIDY